MKIKLLNEFAKIPTRGSNNAAGFDLYAAFPQDTVSIDPGQTVMIGTGIAMEIPTTFWGGVFARSGLSIKEGLRPANCVGVIDSDYRGEVMVAIHNDSDKFRTIHCGDRIAQLIILPYWTPTMDPVDELSDTSRGEGGFGSTGKN